MLSKHKKCLKLVVTIYLLIKKVLRKEIYINITKDFIPRIKFAKILYDTSTPKESCDNYKIVYISYYMSEMCISCIFEDIDLSLDLSYWSLRSFVTMDVRNFASG